MKLIGKQVHGVCLRAGLSPATKWDDYGDHSYGWLELFGNDYPEFSDVRNFEMNLSGTKKNMWVGLQGYWRNSRPSDRDLYIYDLHLE